jgi:DNA integrity scanning protein DisA with diadenylate cyclase activity
MTAPRLHKAHHDSLYPKAVKKNIEAILQDNYVSKGLVSFCSFPIKINAHWIVLVIQIEKSLFDKEYRLEQEYLEFNDYRKYRLDRSFVEAIILVILDKIQIELQAPTQGSNYSFIENPERILEDAASSLLSSIKMHVNIAGGNLFEFGNAISAERYEGSGSKGRLVICNNNNPHISIKINLKVPISIGNYRGIRKLIEISSETMALLCNGESVWGLGYPLDTYNTCSEDLFEIKFTEHYTWELIHGRHVMLVVKYRQARLPRKQFEQSLFCDHISRFFNVTKQEKLILLMEAVEAAMKQRHGTMLIISLHAEKEAERLASQSTVINPIAICGDVISHISSIDGAILISPDGMIYSFGVILDGLASDNGNPSRGARFNSAIRYVDGQNKCGINCFALIVSEDGYVNLYPNIRPRISREFIDILLEDIDKCADSSQVFDDDKAWSTLRKIEEYSFYLLENDVSRANKAKDNIVVRMKQQRMLEMNQTGVGYIIPEFEDFSTHVEMNDEYYL